MTPVIPFPLPPTGLKLTGNEIYIFWAALDQPSSRIEQLAAFLSSDELTRAERFRFETDQRRFIAGRGMLREILGRLLEVEPSELIFSYGTNGKPALVSPLKGRELHFNLAHSAALVVYVVNKVQQCGVDVERVRPIEEVENLAALLFSERENKQWCSLPEHRKMESFLNVWTCKEACLKASGEGIGHRLDQIEVLFTPDQVVRSLSSARDSSNTVEWSIRLLDSVSGFVGALAIQNDHMHICNWKWQTTSYAAQENQDEAMASNDYESCWPNRARSADRFPRCG